MVSMMPSISLPVGLSSACSVMETTRMPLRLSVDFRRTACSRLRVKREYFQTSISLKGAWVLLASSIIFLNSGRSVLRPLSASSTYSPDDLAAVLVGVIPEGPQLGGHGQVHVLAVAGDPGVEGRRRVVGLVGLAAHVCVLLLHSLWFLRASARWRRSRRSHSRSSMYRRMASRRNSLMVRPSSSTTCCTCWAISGGIEKLMTLDFLGMDTLSFLAVTVLQNHTLIMNEPAAPVKGRAPVYRAPNGVKCGG